MGRPRSDSVEYFPMYTAPSKTLQILEDKYGNDGFAFFYKLLRVLSGEQGHFYDARNPVDFEFLSRKCGVSTVLSEKILDDLSLWGKISENLWKKKIIWYQGFVDTLKEVYRTRKRDMPTIDEVYEKTGLFHEKPPKLDSFIGENTSKEGVFSKIIPQSKVKYSKVSADNNSSADASEIIISTPPTPNGEQGGGDKKFKTTECVPFKNSKTEPPNQLLDRYVELIVAKRKKTKTPILDKAGFRVSLKRQLSENPEIADEWRLELAAEDEKIAAMKRAEDAQRAYEHKIQEQQKFSDRFWLEYKSLSRSECQKIRGLAEKKFREENGWFSDAVVSDQFLRPIIVEIMKEKEVKN